MEENLVKIESALRAADEAGNLQEAKRLANLYIETERRQKATFEKKSSQPSVNPFVDAIRSIPGGLAKGVTGVVGMIGDLGNPTQVETVEGLGGELITVDKGANRQGFPTSAQLDKIVSTPTGGYYQPKTTLGKYTETAASFAPAALTGGGGMIARGSRAVIPAIASEGLGQATKGTALEPYARAGGALIAGLGVGKAQRAIQAGKVPVQTTQELKDAANAAYTEAKKSGVLVSENKFKNAVTDIEKKISDEEFGFDAELHPLANRALQRLKEASGNQSFNQLNILRRVVKNAISKSTDKDERRVALTIRDELDKFVKDLKPTEVISGDPQKGLAAFEKARGFWEKVSKDDIITRAVNKAKNRTETISGSGLENALRNEFRKIAQNDNIMRTFSKSEQEAILDIVRGNLTANAFRRLGTFAPSGLKGFLAGSMGSTVGSGIGSYLAGPAGAMIGGPIAGIVTAGAGAAGKKIAELLTKNRAIRAGEVMRGRPPGPQKPSLVKNPALIAALLSKQNREEE